MKCPSCGNPELQEHHHFCYNCGFKLAVVRSSGTSTVSNTSPEQFTATSDHHGSPEVSQSRPDSSPDQCSDDSSQAPVVTESVTEAVKSSKGEFTRDGLSGQNSVNSPSNLNEIQPPQQQGAAPVDFPVKPGKFSVSTDIQTKNQDESTEQGLTEQIVDREVPPGRPPGQLKDTSPPLDIQEHDAPGDRSKGIPPVQTQTQSHSGENGAASHGSVPNNGTQQNGYNSDKEFVTVIFHALLTPTFQYNHEEGDRIFIRGNYPFSWDEQHQVAVRTVREVFDGHFELEGTTRMTLPQAFLRISYKYVVSRTKGRNTPPKNMWECLLGCRPVSNYHVNRSLFIPRDSINNNAIWHQYDDAVFNEPGLWDSICNRIPLLKKVVLDPAEGRRMAMLAMLPDWDSISSCEGGFTASTAMTRINDVVYCMGNQEVENGVYFYHRTFVTFDVMKVLFEYLSPRLNVNTQVQKTQTKDEQAQVKRLVTSVMIASLCVRHRMTFIGDPLLKNMLENLVMHGNVMQKKCMELEGLLQQFPEGQRTMADDLKRMCRYVIEEKDGIFYWLFAVPLLHFLSKSAEPFLGGQLPAAPSSLDDNSWWGTEDLPDFQRVRQQVSNTSEKANTPALLQNQLSSMFELDPLFKRTFLLALPISDMSKVLQKGNFSLHEVCWTLLRTLKERSRPLCLIEEEWNSVEDCIKEMNSGAANYYRSTKGQNWPILKESRAVIL